MTEYAHIRLKVEDHVALATLDRPEKLNALNGALRDDILHLAADIRDDDDVRVLVITGAGRGFCSGADLTGGGRREQLSQNERLDEWGWVGRQALALHELDKPVIAALGGVAAGAGMSLALACDMRVGGPGARFRTVFAERSLSPDSGMSYFLTRILGYARAADLVFTSRDVNAEEAYRLGLLDRLVGEGEEVTTALELGDKIAHLPPLAIRSAKRVLQHNADAGLREALVYETAGLAFARKAPDDVTESAASFRERRAPNFTGS
jgi:2-(1,2-epoxy-1,2-dihydrophenyl)acetyl-CoA isomerase